MFGLGFSEILIIALIFIIFVGPKQLPEVMRTLGGWFREFTKVKEEFTRSMHEDENLRDLKSSVHNLKDQVQSKVDAFKSDVTTEVTNPYSDEDTKTELMDRDKPS